MMEGKSEPNEIYYINKDNFATQATVLAKICRTLKHSKREEPIDQDEFLGYITKSLAFGRCIILVTFNEEEELNGCAILLLNNVSLKGKILWIEWAWTDGKNSDLSKKGLKGIEDLARGLGADKIAGAMTKGFRAVARKFGFREAYRVMEKEIEKEGRKENVKKY